MAVLTTQQMLDQAQAAYHRLLTGTAVRVYIDQNGERVEYTAAKKQDLYAYILQLKSQLGLLPDATIPRPLRFFW